MFDTYETYSCDKPLLAELGLQAFKGKVWEEVFVGEVKTDNDGSYVKIWVTGAPAQFYRFETYCADNGKRYTATTGSGNLKTFWPMVKAMAEDMFNPVLVTEEKA